MYYIVHIVLLTIIFPLWYLTMHCLELCCFHDFGMLDIFCRFEKLTRTCVYGILNLNKTLQKNPTINNLLRESNKHNKRCSRKYDFVQV